MGWEGWEGGGVGWLGGGEGWEGSWTVWLGGRSHPALGTKARSQLLVPGGAEREVPLSLQAGVPACGLGWGIAGGTGALLSPGCGCTRLFPLPKGLFSPGRWAPTHSPCQGSFPPHWCGWDHPEGPTSRQGCRFGAALQGTGAAQGQAPWAPWAPWAPCTPPQAWVLPQPPSPGTAHPPASERSVRKSSSLKNTSHVNAGQRNLRPHPAARGDWDSRPPRAPRGWPAGQRTQSGSGGSAQHQHTPLHEPSLS